VNGLGPDTQVGETDRIIAGESRRIRVKGDGCLSQNRKCGILTMPTIGSARTDPFAKQQIATIHNDGVV
jgi:hypothetical protein